MWTNLQDIADLLTFTKEILNEKLDFLSKEYCYCKMKISANNLMN